jgi:hypothetical protein
VVVHKTFLLRGNDRPESFRELFWMSKFFKRFLLIFIWLPMLIIIAIAVVMMGLIMMGYNPGRTYPSQESIAEMNQAFVENKAQWEQQVANTPRDGTNPKFIILKQMPFDVPEQWFFVYDESDEIAIPRGLHLPFLKSQVSQAGEYSLTAMGHILAQHIEGHFYWIISMGGNNGYALERHGNDYKIVQWNCSTFVEPITSACPDQWRNTSSGKVEAVPEYKAKANSN